jgi:hypothetical protein
LQVRSGTTKQVARCGAAKRDKQSSSFGRGSAGVSFECIRVKKTFPIESAKTVVMRLVPDSKCDESFTVEIVVPGDEGLKCGESHASAKRRVGFRARVAHEVAKVAEKRGHGKERWCR